MTFEEIKLQLKNRYTPLITSTFSASLLFNLKAVTNISNYIDSNTLQELEKISIDTQPKIGQKYGRGDFQYFANSGNNAAGMIFNKVTNEMFITVNLIPGDNYSNLLKFDTGELFYIPQGKSSTPEAAMEKNINQKALAVKNHIFISDTDNYYYYMGSFDASHYADGVASYLYFSGLDTEFIEQKLLGVQFQINKIVLKNSEKNMQDHAIKPFDFERRTNFIREFSGKTSDNRSALAIAKTEHESMLMMIAAYYKEIYGNDAVFESKNEDLIIKKDNFVKIVEVKTTNQNNINDQIRKAFGQLIFYENINFDDDIFRPNNISLEIIISNGIASSKIVNFLKEKFNIEIRKISDFKK